MNAIAHPIHPNQPPHHLIPEDFSKYTFHALLDEARLLLGQERALQYRLAAVLRELDERAHVDGTPMRLPRWLHDVFGFTFGTAREKVRTARALGVENADEEEDSYWARRADALTQVMADSLGGQNSTPGDRHQVVVHVAAETLAENVPAGTFSRCVPAEPVLHPETIRRLACVHWAMGGKTNLDNLVLLCNRHHVIVHEMGYHIRRKRAGTNAGIEIIKPEVGS